MVPGALWAVKSATTACMRKNGAFRFTAMCASNSSGVVSSRVTRLVSTAALTRLSTRPNSAITVATQARAWATSADVGLHEQCLSAGLGELGGQRFARLAARR